MPGRARTSWTRPDDPARARPPSAADVVSPTARFALERHAGPYERWPSHSRLFADGRATATRVPGYTRLHQYELNDGYLLVTDHDCPFEEITAFTLLDPELRIVAERKVGRMYNTCLLTGLRWLDGRRLVASFGDDSRVLVTIRRRGFPLLHPWLKLQRLRQHTASPAS